MAYNIDLTGPFDYDGVISNDFFAAASLYFADRAPLVSRLPNRPCSASTVKAVDDAFRAKSTTINEGAAFAIGDTTLTLTDGTFFLPGDVIQIESELLLVTAASGNNLTVTRGYAGTTAAAHADATVTYLIGNTRTGAEVDQSALTRVFDTSLTYPQTAQQPYQIGGSLEAKSGNMVFPMGFSSMVGYQRAKAMQEVLFDLERSAYYGQVVPLAGDTTRPMMRGLRQRLVTNITTAPTNASAYKPSDLQRDLFSRARAGGGQPDILICSQEFEQAFFVWGLNLTLNPSTIDVLGVNVTTWRAPAIGGASIVFAPLLRPYSAFVLTSEEVSMAWVREPFDKPRGSRGDAEEGDVIGEGCILVNNESHHAWVEGITGWARQT